MGGAARQRESGQAQMAALAAAMAIKTGHTAIVMMPSTSPAIAIPLFAASATVCLG